MKKLLFLIAFGLLGITTHAQTTKDVLISKTEENLKSKLHNPQSYKRVNVSFTEFKKVKSLQYDLNNITGDKKDSLLMLLSTTNDNVVEYYVVEIDFNATNKYGGVVRESYMCFYPTKKPIDFTPCSFNEADVFASRVYDLVTILPFLGYTYDKYSFLMYGR